MKILCIATKAPWPPHDGGRLVLWHGLQGLAQAGHAVRLIAPVPAAADADVLAALRTVCEPTLVPVPTRGWAAATRAALHHGTSVTVARHTHAAVRDAVAEALRSFDPHVLHVEQLQALAHASPAQHAGRPGVLRMQNVESSLWSQAGAARLHLRPLRIEAARLVRDEREALARSTRTLALSERDAHALRRIAPRAGTVACVPPAFPSTLDAGPPLPNDDASADAIALTLAGSAGWWPNRDGARWFLADVMPLLQQRLPQARLHVFGGAHAAGAGVVVHAAPADARLAFPSGAIALVPLRVGSGIRMRILEAWARGLPVVATSAAAAGLAPGWERAVCVADTPRAMVEAVVRLARDATQRAQLADAGRHCLAAHHDPQRQTAALVAAYTEAIGAAAVAGGTHVCG